jgi:hypothetical protein
MFLKENDSIRKQLIEIYNINGQLIETQHIMSQNEVIPTNLKQGVYIIKIYNNNQISTNKIIVR